MHICSRQSFDAKDSKNAGARRVWCATSRQGASQRAALGSARPAAPQARATACFGAPRCAAGPRNKGKPPTPPTRANDMTAQLGAACISMRGESATNFSKA
eukprot:8051907-Alexandrium_andersonii.AAC.1